MKNIITLLSTALIVLFLNTTTYAKVPQNAKIKHSEDEEVRYDERQNL